MWARSFRAHARKASLTTSRWISTIGSWFMGCSSCCCSAWQWAHLLLVSNHLVWHVACTYFPQQFKWMMLFLVSELIVKTTRQNKHLSIYSSLSGANPRIRLLDRWLSMISRDRVITVVSVTDSVWSIRNVWALQLVCGSKMLHVHWL